MKKIWLFVFSVCFSLCATFAQSVLEPKFSGWKQSETAHFRFIYEDAYREVAERYALFADDAWSKIGKIYSIPQEKTDIFITARTNTVNAFTFFLPPEILMFDTAITENTFGFRDDWMKLFFTHELVHIANFKFEDKKYVAGKIFGCWLDSLAFATIPGWAVEGITTVLETELTDGGRGRSPYFELMYKAPTLENSFISYNEIGLEKEPPHGQSYVMGYLIMRSIADRWGLPSLADIERNRSFFTSWEESVKLVTGESASDIYKDVKIALVKKYALERNIPEGVTITPRNTNTSYYTPALIDDDGTIITLRAAKGKSPAVVRYDPTAKSGSNYYSKYYYIEENEQEKISQFSETILFAGSFSDTDAVTAATDGNIYAVMKNQVNEKRPGTTTENAIYKWNKTKGLSRLTKGHSFSHPSVSRDGKVLVATEQIGLDCTIAQIDPQTGEVATILQERGIGFIQPSLNSDGTKISFLVIDGKRAKVAVADMNDIASYKIVANDSGEITDPSSPHFNSDGSLLYCNNARGRLEVFEVSESQSKPVVSDPIAALWAYKTPRGVYYQSYAATGYVTKMKPSSEWGVVPETTGPSKPGEVLSFGSLERDYPDFAPYKPNEKIAEEINKILRHRTEENVAKSEQQPQINQTLQNEKKFVSIAKPMLYLPLPSLLTTGQDDSDLNWGFGCFVFSLAPLLQLKPAWSQASIFYYPSLKNFSASLSYTNPIGPASLDMFVTRSLKNIERPNGAHQFVESNEALIGYTTPFYRKNTPTNSTDLSLLSSASFITRRMDESPFSIDSSLDYKFQIEVIAGLDLAQTFAPHKKKNRRLSATAVAIGEYLPQTNKFYIGAEWEAEYVTGNTFKLELATRGRYTDFEPSTIIGESRAHLTGYESTCEYQGHLIFRTGIAYKVASIVNLEAFTEKEFLFGTNSESNQSQSAQKFTDSKSVFFGAETNGRLDRIFLAAGVSCNYDYGEKKFNFGKFYTAIRFDWLRH